MNPHHHPSSEPLDPRWNEFESRLALNRFRTPPSELRDRVLAAALCAPKPRDPRAARAVALPGARSAWPAWSAWMERWSSGWTVAAAAWGVVMVLNQFSSSDSPSRQRVPPPWSERAMAEIRAQRSEVQDFAEGATRPQIAQPTPEAVPPPPRDPHTRAGSEPQPNTLLV